MKKALLLIMILTLGHRAWGQATNSIFPAQSFTASAQTGATIQLNRASSTSTIGSNFSVGTVTVTGTSLTTVTFAVMGSSDNGVTFFALPIGAVASPGSTPTTTVTATTSGLYQVNLVGITHVYVATSGTFTATSVSLVLTASPNGSISRVGTSGGSFPDAPAAGYAPVSTASGTGAYTAQLVPSLSTASLQQFHGPIGAKIINGVSNCAAYSGLTLDVQVNACILDATGLANGNFSGIADAQGLNNFYATAAEIDGGNSSGAAGLLILPCGGSWQGGMTDGTSVTYKQFAGFDTVTHCPIAGATANFYFGATGGSNVYAIYEQIGTPNQYIHASGFEILNSAGHATASHYSVIVDGGNYVFSDGSTITNVNVNDFSNPAGGAILFKNICCGYSWNWSAFNANFGGIPVTLQAYDSPGSGIPGSYIQKVNFIGDTMVDPGAGKPIVSCTDTRAGKDSYADWAYGYSETNGSDTTGNLVSSTCQQLTFSHYGVYSNKANNAQQWASTGTGITIDDMHFYPGVGTWVYPVAVEPGVVTDASGNFGIANPPGVPSQLGPINGLTLLSNATGFQLSGGTTSKTFKLNNTLTLAGTDGTTFTFPSTSDTVATLAATQSLSNKTLNLSPIGTTAPSTGKFTSLSNSLMQNGTDAVIASAATIAPTAPLVEISGTTPINTITLPSGFTSGCFNILATGAWSTTTAGNIFATMTASANTMYQACFWTGITKWTIK